MILNGKKKSYLRGLAQTLRPMFQIGKEGLTQEVITEIQNYITKNELGKLTVLDSCPISKEDVAEQLANENLSVVQIIGNQIILFRRNPKKEDGIRFSK